MEREAGTGNAGGEGPLDFEPQMVRVPGGEFLMGSDPGQEPEAVDWEAPQHRLALPDYMIGRTPVTNAQYAAFLQATGHRRPRRWRGDKPPRGQEGLPVVYVSWHDAVAYCRWLSEATGRPYRLPGEAEWEKAAGWEVGDWEIGESGAVKRRYPWGNRWSKRRCNTAEGEVGKVTPVEAYPDGASGYGLLDMAGNTWEWTRSLWGRDWFRPAFVYPYAPDDGREEPAADDGVAGGINQGATASNCHFELCARPGLPNPGPHRRIWQSGGRK